MIREVLVYPNKKLKEVSEDVESFDRELHTLLDDMYETMIAKEGIGLAAIQVGVPLNVLIINLPNEEGEQRREDLIEVVNPKILKKEGKEVYQEGCLSIPGFYEEIERAKDIEVEYSDRYGNRVIKKMSGLLSIAMQHEMDHLKGHLFIEKLSYLKRKKFEKEWKKKLKTGK